jgi:hypothetical protein
LMAAHKTPIKSDGKLLTRPCIICRNSWSTKMGWCIKETNSGPAVEQMKKAETNQTIVGPLQPGEVREILPQYFAPGVSAATVEIARLKTELESVKAERDALLTWQRERKDYKAECIKLRAEVEKLGERLRAQEQIDRQHDKSDDDRIEIDGGDTFLYDQ